MPDLDELRERAARHDAVLNRNKRFYTVADLAARWQRSATSVRAIPATDLPYINVGQGLVKEARRYDPDDVETYEFVHFKKAG